MRVSFDFEGWRWALALWLHGLAKRVCPDWARRQEDAERALAELGDYAYEGAAWTSPRVMVGAALKKSRVEGVQCRARLQVGGEELMGKLKGSYRTPTEAMDDDRDCTVLGVSRIRLSPAQEALLRRTAGEEHGGAGETYIGDHEIRTADVLADWAFVEQVQRQGRNAIKITNRGEKWLRA